MSQGFKGFLLQYCRELTGLETTSLKRLFAAVAKDSPRAGEPLLLLALSQDRAPYLLQLAKGTPWHAKYAAFVEQHASSQESLEPFLETLPANDRFGKTYRAWRSEAGRLERDRNTLVKVSAAMNELLADKEMTRYEASRKLKLDKGNFYAFLKGDATRLSRDTAMDAYRKLAAL